MPIRKAKSYPDIKQVIARPASRKVRKALANLLVNFSGETRQTAKGIVFQCLVWPLEYELQGVWPKPPKGNRRINQTFHNVDVTPSFKNGTLTKTATFSCVGGNYKFRGYIVVDR